MESVNKKVILIAVIMSLITSFLIYVYIKKATKAPEIETSTHIYVAARTLPSKHLVADGDLKQVAVANKYINPNAVHNKAEIVGKRLKDRVIEGEQILRERLVDENNLTLSYNIPDGMRAVSMNVNEQIEVADLIRPGDFVDIIASFDREEVDDGTSKTIYPRISQTIIQKVQILALGQAQVVEEGQARELPKTVTVAVTPQDAEKLTYASEYGVLRMALRPVDDKENANTKGITRSDMVGSKGVVRGAANTAAN